VLSWDKLWVDPVLGRHALSVWYALLSQPAASEPRTQSSPVWLIFGLTSTVAACKCLILGAPTWTWLRPTYVEKGGCHLATLIPCLVGDIAYENLPTFTRPYTLTWHNVERGHGFLHNYVNHSLYRPTKWEGSALLLALSHGKHNYSDTQPSWAVCINTNMTFVMESLLIPPNWMSASP
jgi:hypothetical protein